MFQSNIKLPAALGTSRVLPRTRICAFFLVAALAQLSWTVDAFSIPTPFSILGGGGRAPQVADKVDKTETWEPSSCKPTESRLIVIQVTDVYTLENFAHLKTLVEETREKSQGAKVVCLLSGDFLSPYLLSSVDNGAGMMNALNKVPMDYLSWGNHEADIDHKTTCRYVRNFPGVWLNSNMLDHDAMDCQQEYDVIEIPSPDGSQTRKVGLCAVLSDDPALYCHFEEPGAFGGATLTDPWEALTKYKHILEKEEGCDVVLPLQHLYVPDDHRTCREFDFPVILSGHDHHRVDEVVEGTRLLKPGHNADYATVLEFSWSDNNADKPNIRSRFVRCKDWAADPALAEECERAYDCLDPLRNTELARVPPNFEPLTSNGSRESVCTMGMFVCSLLKSALNVSKNLRKYQVDSVLLMGGNIRGNADYELGSFFSLEALEAEVKSDEVVGIVPMPGWLLARGIEETHSGEPIPGWLQYDEGITEDEETGKVTHVAGEPLIQNEVYRVATKISDLTNGQCGAWTAYYTQNKHLLPPKGSYFNIHAELMSYFSRNLWRRLYEAISREISDVSPCDLDDVNCNAQEHLKALDLTGNGVVTVDEIQVALKEYLGFSVDERERTLAKFVHDFADQNGDGSVTKKDLEIFLEELIQMSEKKEQGPPLELQVRSDGVEVHDDDGNVVIQLDGKQRNFICERGEPPEPMFPDLGEVLSAVFVGEDGDGPVSSDATTKP